jgi:hypothetical protein
MKKLNRRFVSSTTSIAKHPLASSLSLAGDLRNAGDRRRRCIVVVLRPDQWRPEKWSDEPPWLEIIGQFRGRGRRRDLEIVRNFNLLSLERNGRTWAIMR